jgi:3-phenylpropionate/trans-cinnamate dioxygenase ferredoxin reductase subunit
MKFADVAIVGAGHAGAHCAMALRAKGFHGSILVVGDEPEFPYERPPLSKEYLSGEKAFDRLLIRQPAYWADKHIEFLFGRTVTAVSPHEHIVTTDDGEPLGYGKLVWATGGEPRRLDCPGRDIKGVHYIRRRADIDRLQAEAAPSKRIVVIGGGYIGLEAAAVLNKLGKDVVVVEQLDRVLARVAGEPLSRFFEAQHRAHGVGVRLGERVECLDARDGRVDAVRLEGGERLDADIVIVGIGIIPSVAPLIAAGAVGGNGVLVDERCQTSLPDILAIGDCAAHSNPFAPDQKPIRLESVQNAADQAEIAAETITGGHAAYDALPWFWSHQYDIKLQTIGLSTGHTEVVTRGEIASGRFSLIYLRDDTLIGIDCINSPKDFIQGRKLIMQNVRSHIDEIADADIPLKTSAENLALHL